MWHKDPECEQALIKLNDALCSWERDTGRKSILILIPEAADEPIVMSQSGKLLPKNFNVSPEEILAIAMRGRELKKGRHKIKNKSLC